MHRPNPARSLSRSPKKQPWDDDYDSEEGLDEGNKTSGPSGNTTSTELVTHSTLDEEAVCWFRKTRETKDATMSSVIKKFLTYADKSQIFNSPDANLVSFSQLFRDYLEDERDRSLVFEFLRRDDVWEDSEEAQRWTRHKVMAFIDWMLKLNPNLINTKDNETQTKPLMLAIMKKRDWFVECILEKEDIMLPLLTDQSTIHGTCLHTAIAEKSPFVSRLMRLSMENNLLSKADRSGNNPLHTLVDQLGDEMDPKRLQKVLGDASESKESSNDDLAQPRNNGTKKGLASINDRLG
ncbi:hypothetical protein GGR54DRAFT_269284 [Hypoxylon sp. NC1633]|nr:hypothetical protein GGR54DRAFT_269284 [Hypoxylon sp. NC1633]